MVKKCGSNVVLVGGILGPDAFASFIIPQFQLEIIAARYEERLVAMKVNSTNWSLVFVELFNQCLFAVAESDTHSEAGAQHSPERVHRLAR